MQLKASLEHKNFKAFRGLMGAFHAHFGFDVVALLLHRTVPCAYVPLLLAKLVAMHKHDWNVLRRYERIVVEHFEACTNDLLAATSEESDDEGIEAFAGVCEATHTANFSAAGQCRKHFPPVLSSEKFAMILAESVAGGWYCLLFESVWHRCRVDAIEIGHMFLCAGRRGCLPWCLWRRRCR